jgi:hypothetical protein
MAQYQRWPVRYRIFDLLLVRAKFRTVLFSGLSSSLSSEFIALRQLGEARIPGLAVIFRL